MPEWPTWAEAWERALYGPNGFYRRPEGPAGHFRTAAHAAPAQLATALDRLALQHGCTAIVDVGAGRGELLTALASVSSRRLWGVDVVARPSGLPASIGWSPGLDATPDLVFEGALVIGWELLDVVPCPILEVDDVPRIVRVDPRTGRESLGEPAPDADRAWCDRWWPLGSAEAGDRAEVGAPRDELWSDLTRRASAAGAIAALAVDYAHRRHDRPNLGSLSGFRAGRAVPARPDGSMDLTAHVAIDAIAAAGTGTAVLTTQHEALAALGVTNRELLDPGALGGFAWLEHRL